MSIQYRDTLVMSKSNTIINTCDHIIFVFTRLWLRFGVIFEGHGQLDPQPLRPSPLRSSATPVVVVVGGGGDSLFGGEDALPDGHPCSKSFKMTYIGAKSIKYVLAEKWGKVAKCLSSTFLHS